MAVYNSALNTAGYNSDFYIYIYINLGCLLASINCELLKKEMGMGLGKEKGKAGHLSEQKMRRSELVS